MAKKKKGFFDSLWGESSNDYQTPEQRALGSADDQKLGKLGIGALHLKRGDIPDVQLDAVARADVVKYGAPEHFKKVAGLCDDDKSQRYIDSFNRVQQELLAKDEQENDESDAWKTRVDTYSKKQKDWMDNKNWGDNEPSCDSKTADGPKAAGSSWFRVAPLVPLTDASDENEASLDPFSDGVNENATIDSSVDQSLDPFGDALGSNDLSVDPFADTVADEASDISLAMDTDSEDTDTVDINDWDDDMDESDDFDSDPNDPFA